MMQVAAKVILILLVMSRPMVSLAFSRAAHITRQKMHNNNSLKSFSTLDPMIAVDTSSETLACSFNPIGPPDFLSNLSVGQSICSHGKNITRLSSSPDIYLVKDLIPAQDRQALIQAAQSQGMKIAGTRASKENVSRSKY